MGWRLRKVPLGEEALADSRISRDVDEECEFLVVRAETLEEIRNRA